MIVLYKGIFQFFLISWLLKCNNYSNLLNKLTDFGGPFLDSRGKRLLRVINGSSSLLLEVKSFSIPEWMTLKCKVQHTDAYGSDGL